MVALRTGVDISRSKVQNVLSLVRYIHGLTETEGRQGLKAQGRILNIPFAPAVNLLAAG